MIEATSFEWNKIHAENMRGTMGNINFVTCYPYSCCNVSVAS